MGFLLTTLSTILCPHGGKVILQTSNSTVSVGGARVLLLTDIHVVAGCPFFRGNTPSPCLQVKWITGTTTAGIGGVPMLSSDSSGICIGPGGPQGSPNIVSYQNNVTA